MRIWRQEIRNQLSMLALCGEENITFAEAGRLNRRSDVEDVVTLRNSEGLRVNVALNKASVNLRRWNRMIKAVLTCLETATAFETQKIKDIPATNNTVLFHQHSDGRRAGPGRDIDEGFG